MVFYIRSNDSQTNLWKSSSDGRSSVQLTRLGSDVIGLSATPDSTKFAIVMAPERQRLQRFEDEEARYGILYDEHILAGFPLTDTLPVIDRWRPVRKSASGELRPLGWDGVKEQMFDVRRGTLSPDLPSSKVGPVPGGGHNELYRVKVVAIGQIPGAGRLYYGGQYTLQLEAKKADEYSRKCDIQECNANEIDLLGWSSDQTEFYYVADSAQGRAGTEFPGRATVFAWNPFRDVVRPVYRPPGRLFNLNAATGLALADVPIINGNIVIAMSGADEPPEVESINLATGLARVVFDPNAELRAKTHGRAIWHAWPTSTGYPGRGVMILPTGYEAGKRYPTVITTYTCGNGFLSGGSGDNVSEFAAADQGFLSICVDFTIRDMMARETDLSHIHRIFCDTIAALITDQDTAGTLDPTRVGLSGQSLGANAAAYCVSHERLFAAAALRHGSLIERPTWELLNSAGSRKARINGVYADFLMPDPRNDPEGRWDEESIANRASDIDAPLLIQANETEYLRAIPLWSALHEIGKPVEMFVFPRDSHKLIQPAHRLVNYERQIDWFRFWLKHEKDPSADKQDQYLRWERLRTQASRSP